MVYGVMPWANCFQNYEIFGLFTVIVIGYLVTGGNFPGVRDVMTFFPFTYSSFFSTYLGIRNFPLFSSVSDFSKIVWDGGKD